MARAFLIVMDSVGCGGAPDAADFGDGGSNTLGHIAQACAAGRADVGRAVNPARWQKARRRRQKRSSPP